MQYKRILGFFLLILSLPFIISGFSFNFTGGFVQDYFTHVSLKNIFGLIFFMLGFFLVVQKENLEYLVIPVGLEKWQNPKARSARQTIESGHVDRVIITGDVEGEKRRYKANDEANPSVYGAIRTAGIKPSHVRLLKGKDSEEDILYLGQMVHSGDTIYFDTFPLHFKEYQTLVKKAQRDGKFPKNVSLRNAKIPQGKTEVAYGLMGWMEEVFKRRPLSYKSERENSFLDGVKGVVKKFIGA